MKFDTDCVEISSPTSVNPAGTSVTPKRGFEPVVEQFANATEASRKGNGPRPFMGHGGPVADASGVDRGQFSSRSVKQGPV